jgi:hypothetical protein
MKQLTIHIPERKFQFVMELLHSLDFIKIDAPKAEKFVITEEQKALVDEELRKIEADPGYLLDWDDVKHQLNID